MTFAAGARLAHFPEGFLPGCGVENVAGWDDVDRAVVRHELEEVAALAGELGIWVVLGSAHPLTPSHRPHNSLYVISDEGKLVDRFDKQKSSEGLRRVRRGPRPSTLHRLRQGRMMRPDLA